MFIEILKIVASLAWPLLIVVIFLKLLPAIRKLIESRGFTLKFAGIEVTAQEATDQIKAQLQDLKDQVIELRQSSLQGSSTEPRHYNSDTPRSILWVDDEPINNALEISQMEGRGYKITLSSSTNGALSELAGGRFDLVISDMARQEGGLYSTQAGLILLKAMRQSGHTQPLILYTTTRSADKYDTEVKAMGGVGATASPTTLLEWIGLNIPK